MSVDQLRATIVNDIHDNGVPTRPQFLTPFIRLSRSLLKMMRVTQPKDCTDEVETVKSKTNLLLKKHIPLE